MLRYKIFSCTCTDTWCYINRPSLVFAQALEIIRSSLVLAHLHRRLGLVLRYKSSLAHAQTLAALQGGGLPGRGDHHLWGRLGVAGLRDHTIGGGTGPRTDI